MQKARARQARAFESDLGWAQDRFDNLIVTPNRSKSNTRNDFNRGIEKRNIMGAEQLRHHDLSVLEDHHVQLLQRESGISAEIISAAGLRSFSVEEADEQLGIDASGIGFPYHDLDGRLLTYRLRLDDPRGDGDKIYRYHQPKGSILYCFFLPTNLAQIKDPSKPLIVVEGEKKALAVAGAIGIADYAIVSYPGCWNFKSEGEVLGSTWAAIPLENRAVKWVPDGNFFTNPSVFAAGGAFVAQLTARGATVELFGLGKGGQP